jgi:cold shock CspA family protein
MASAEGVCSYCGKLAEDIPGLRFLRGVLFSDSEGRPHCFSKANFQKQKAAVGVAKKKVVIPDLVPEEPASETQEQADLLWTSALKKDMAPGIAEDRILGTAVKWCPIRGFGFILSEDGEEYYASVSEIAADQFGFSFLEVGETVSFRTLDHRTTPSSELSATSVIPAHVDLGLSAPANYREEFVVVKFDDRLGSGRLAKVSDSRAPWISFRKENVITEGTITLGVKVWCGFHRTPGFNYFSAHKIEICRE